MSSDFTNLVNEYKNNDIEKFKEQLGILKVFVTDNEWFNMLKYDIALNPTLANEITKIINFIDVENFTSDDYMKLIKKLRNKCIALKEEADKCLEPDLKWFKYRHAYAYYGIIEVITEGSIVTDHILNSFKEKYKDDYLAVLKEIDNYVPSTLTNFDTNNSEKINLNDENIKLYLIMKYYQDDQHVFHEDNLISEHRKARCDFEKIIKEDYPHLEKVSGKSLLMLYILDNTPIIDIKALSRFILVGEGKNLSNIIGGKNLGLVKLYTYGYNIPKTYAVSVSSLKNELYCEELKKLENQNFAVRSSATVEDNENNSFAGLFTSVLDVSKEDLNIGIKKVYDSANNPRVLSYVNHFNLDKPYMSIVIQKYKEPTISGVWIGNGIDSGCLEWVYGNGEKLVSGHIKPNLENWPNENGNVLEVNNKKVGIELLEFQKKLNCEADLEWCILDGELMYLQYRPVTKNIEFKNCELKDKESYIGVAASSGKVIGKPIYLDDPDDILKFTDGSILLTDYTDPDWVPVILKSSAIVTAEGGFLSHTAIISRELGLPCVTGLGYAAIEKLKNEEEIEVNGTNGSVKKYSLKMKK